MVLLLRASRNVAFFLMVSLVSSVNLSRSPGGAVLLLAAAPMPPLLAMMSCGALVKNSLGLRISLVLNADSVNRVL